MPTKIIANSAQFQLLAEVKPSVPGKVSLELPQLWPQAQNPHLRRIAQLNLAPSEVLTLAQFLIHSVGV